MDPELGLSASPLRNNIYEWHANIKGFADTPYENGIFHFKITVPKDYPNSAPSLEALTNIHNNFFQGRNYRSDMLGNEWCTGFSIFSILMQVQAGLFDYMGGQADTIRQEA